MVWIDCDFCCILGTKLLKRTRSLAWEEERSKQVLTVLASC
jgi:hypothetical protein